MISLRSGLKDLKELKILLQTSIDEERYKDIVIDLEFFELEEVRNAST